MVFGQYSIPLKLFENFIPVGAPKRTYHENKLANVMDFSSFLGRRWGDSDVLSNSEKKKSSRVVRKGLKGCFVS